MGAAERHNPMINMGTVLHFFVITVLGCYSCKSKKNVDFAPDETMNKSVQDLLSRTVTDKRNIEPF